MATFYDVDYRIYSETTIINETRHMAVISTTNIFAVVNGPFTNSAKQTTGVKSLLS